VEGQRVKKLGEKNDLVAPFLSVCPQNAINEL
jgi:hypothetical protein